MKFAITTHSRNETISAPDDCYAEPYRILDSSDSDALIITFVWRVKEPRKPRRKKALKSLGKGSDYVRN